MEKLAAKTWLAMRLFLAAAMVLLSCSNIAFASDFLTGYQAEQRGDYAEAAKFYRRAGDNGDAVSLGALGFLYKEGKGVPQDYAEALKLYRRAADLGSISAQISVGVMYDFGYGVAQDYAEAVKWYRKAADQGDATGQFELGMMYELGHGVPMDLTEAAALYRKSADQGNTFGKRYLAKLEGVEPGTKDTAAEAVAAPPLPPPAPSPPIDQPAENRVALVIGNSGYRTVAGLPNASNDADLVGKALKSAGFSDVAVVKDLDRAGLVAALKDFRGKADKAEWALIYYAGHGIEVGGKNYLVPVDAVLRDARDVETEAISLDQVLTSVDGARTLRLIALDACRENPFAAQMNRPGAQRAIGRGLARIEPGDATLVFYAAKDGTTAADGDGVDSPFAQAFAKRIAEPGVEVNLVLRFVISDVEKATGHAQRPVFYGSLPPTLLFFTAAK